MTINGTSWATRLAVGLLLALSSVAMAREPDFAFPQDIAGFARGVRTDYESRAPGYGYSVVYANGRWKADVYVCDGRVAVIPDGPSSPSVATQIAQATDEISTMVERGYYHGSQDRGSVQLGGTTGKRLACHAFAIDHAKLGPLDSLLCVTGLRGKFVKFRLSSPAAKQAPQVEAEQFMAGWLAQQ